MSARFTDIEKPAAGTTRVVALPLGGELVWTEGFLSPMAAASALAALRETVPWRQEHVVLFGRRIAQPRLSCWMGDDGATYTYSGASFEPAPWVPAVSDVRARVEAATGQRFNSVLLNLYRDGADSMGFHADDEPELGPAPVIGSVSLGASRRFVLRPKKRRGEAPAMRLSLDDGSLLVMRGETQRFWVHGVPKEPRVDAARVNLTFRRIEIAANLTPSGTKACHASAS
jgi:alkylated DNA repair dioxygenase AlkB